MNTAGNFLPGRGLTRESPRNQSNREYVQGVEIPPSLAPVVRRRQGSVMPPAVYTGDIPSAPASCRETRA